MPLNNDNDIKIFETTKKPSDDMSEEIRIAEGMTVQRRNGNSVKAKKLGIKLANNVIEANRSKINIEKILAKSGIDDQYRHQADVLTIFIAESSLESFLPSQFLAATAINAMYDAIMEQNEELYNELSDGAEFSLYYLHLRRGKDISDNIGKAFAMLCSKSDDVNFSTQAKDFYEAVLDETKELIEKVKFA